MVSFALIPITLSVGRAPAFETPESIGIRALFRASPLGVAGALLIGVAHSALYSMGPVYGTEIGLAVDRTALFIAVALFGGLVLQWPIGWLSDRFDRRKVIVAVAWLATGASIGAGAGGIDSYAVLIGSTALLGGMSMPLYSLCGAHTNDHLSPRQIVAASATLVLVGGLGLTMGPLLAAALMHIAGPSGLFWLLAVVHGGIGAYGLFRMVRRDPVPLEEQRTYDPVSPAHVARRPGRDGPRMAPTRGTGIWRVGASCEAGGATAAHADIAPPSPRNGRFRELPAPTGDRNPCDREADWYLSITTELLDEASQRFERYASLTR